MRWAALALLLAAGCPAAPGDGSLKCGGNAVHPCPDGYDCISGSCWAHGRGPDMTAAIFDDDMAVAGQDMVATPDLAELPDLTSATPDLAMCHAAVVGLPCCPATLEEAQQLPSPPNAQKGQGRCDPGLACAYGQCAARSACPDGSHNGTDSTVYVIYCVSL